jgi:hypothetical protein
MPQLLAAVEWNNGIEHAWTSVATFVPKFLGFLVILVLGYVIAKAIAKAVDAVLERVGFDRAVERGGIRAALAKSKYDASDIVAKIVFYGLMLFVLQLAFGIFGANPVSDLITGVIAFLPKLFAAIVIVVVASAIAAAVKDLVGNALGGLSYGKMLANVASVSILVIGAFMALNQIQIAPAIVNGLFYGLLAVIVGSAIIAIGGGGIQPMRQRWEHVLAKVDEEGPRMRQQLQAQKARKEIDLRQPQAAAPSPSMGADATVPMGAGTTSPAVAGPGEVTGMTTQDRIRAEVTGAAPRTRRQRG